MAFITKKKAFAVELQKLTNASMYKSSQNYKISMK